MTHRVQSFSPVAYALRALPPAKGAPWEVRPSVWYTPSRALPSNFRGIQN
ncbi:MAG: hypothetical protein LM549_10080 [Candidatus Competibacter sp.]|nr:hypothetical protein [Candidatus Competibacter sp.]